jgi:hypothetical protein
MTGTEELFKPVLTILLSTCAFFLLRLITQLDKNTTACNTLTEKLSNVSGSIIALEAGAVEAKTGLSDLRKEVRYQSERQHAIVTRVTALGTVMAHHNLLESPEWDIPQRPQE